ncbi:hypothetical protein SmJEL517_g05519 [Synchytrium microbalum]|uniref:Uncharacterized protein n=1 Tax=Synchytrium microbalum TaxID=1806994 RepID=A0A507C0K2_9FUNG|nr:uncharacterized protein SmJEL517_g05519 [Synchytrium microbalum]TPX31063.1 hypothetical protein SmJEL517_g05519 [Synchytrium microbalum]
MFESKYIESSSMDRFGVAEDGAGPSGLSLRERPLAPEMARERQLADEFFASTHAQQGHMPNDFYNFRDMNRELDSMAPPSMAQHNGDWAADFAKFNDGGMGQMHDQHQFREFEEVFQQARTQAHGQWEDQFAQFQREHPGFHAEHAETEAAFEKAFEQAQQSSSWEEEFAKEQTSWADEFVTQQAEVNVDSTDALSKTAGMLLDIVSTSTNPKFKESKFMAFMQKLRDQEVAIEGNKVVEQTPPVRGEAWAQQFQQQEQSWEDEFTTPGARALASSDGWTNEFASSQNREASWAEEYGETAFANPPKVRTAEDWAQEFQAGLHTDSSARWEAEFEQFRQNALERNEAGDNLGETEDYQEMEKAFKEYYGMQDWVREYKNKVADEISRDPQNEEWDAMEKNWDEYNSPALAYRANDPRYDNYEFMPNNPYLSRPAPYLENPLSHRNLTESVLALEAAVQLDPGNASAWHHLGIRQQENENETAAIAALRQATQLDPSILDAWIGLAVSYTNENCREDANEALEAWMANSDKYHMIIEKAGGIGAGAGLMSAAQRHGHVINLFLEAARANPGEHLDPDVQIALGVLFNVSEEYDKAVDCFEAALVKRPQDYLLWNKLGATLANSNKTPRALDAYFAALEINPSYIRARYNIAISCIQLGNHREAAEHLLGALGIQQSNAESLMLDGKGKGPAGNNVINMHSIASDNVWSTLKMVVDSYLRRPDLADACDRRDLTLFRGDFDF